MHVTRPLTAPPRRLRPLLRVGLPVAVAAALVCLAIVDIASVRTWRGEVEDGVLWTSVPGSPNVVALDVAKGTPAERAGIQPRDVLVRINATEVTAPADVQRIIHDASEGTQLAYVI